MTQAGDLRVRIAAFDWLNEKTAVYPHGLPRMVLEQGFRFEGNRVPLIGPQGIFRPNVPPI